MVRGEAGVGKTALLDYVAGDASACRSAARVCSRRWNSPSPGCTSCGRRCWAALSVPDAARTRWDRVGVLPGTAADRFFVGLAVLSLLSTVAEEQPLICLVDDEQWLDRASAQVLAFVARRLEAEGVGLVFAARGLSDDVAGLPELVVEGLGEADARLLLDSVLSGRLDAQARDRILAESRATRWR